VHVAPGMEAHAHDRHSPTRWLSWILGVAAIAALVVFVVQLSEERAFMSMLERANPWWVIVAFALQLLTYAAEGAIWRIIARRTGATLSIGAAFRLSVTKLFVDQSLPSGGLSGAAVVAGALERRGIGRPIAIATLVVDIVGYYVAYLVALVSALVISRVQGHAGIVVVFPAVLFSSFAAAVIVVLLVFAGRGARSGAKPAWIPFLRRALLVIRRADRDVVRDLRNLLAAASLELAIILLDAATVWTLIRALGFDAPVVGVYAAFLVASLFRTISITPAGLGAFEAASVIALENAGVPLAVALSATLLFRGLSFWLPMLPGLVLARQLRTAPPDLRGAGEPPIDPGPAVAGARSAARRGV